MAMEACYPNQGNYSYTGYPAQLAPQRNQISVQQGNQSEQPPMPPEAQAALSQLKSMPCPMTNFPQSMKNQSSAFGWNTGSAGMQGGFPNYQNPHAGNNQQIHAQNFQLHQELHGMGMGQSGFQNAMSNSQRQHTMNPQLHADNRKMHQSVHGGQSSQGQNFNAVRSERRNASSNQGNVNNQNAYSGLPSSKVTPQAISPGNQMVPYSGHQSTNQHPHSSTQPNYYSASHQQAYPAGHTFVNQSSTGHFAGHPMGQHSANQYSTGHSAGQPMTHGNSQYSRGHHSMNEYSAGKQYMGSHAGPHEETTSHHAAGHNFANQYPSTPQKTEHSPTCPHATGQHSVDASTTHAHSHGGSMAHGISHEVHMGQNNAQHHTHTNANFSHEHPEHVHSSQVPAETYSYDPNGHLAKGTYSVGRQDSSRQVQGVLYPEHEPHLTVVQKTMPQHEMVKIEEHKANDRGEVCPHVTEILPYTGQGAANYHSMMELPTMAQRNFVKNNGLQGIKSSPAFIPKTWVIGPPARKPKHNWTKSYM